MEACKTELRSAIFDGQVTASKDRRAGLLWPCSGRPRKIAVSLELRRSSTTRIFRKISKIRIDQVNPRKLQLKQNGQHDGISSSATAHLLSLATELHMEIISHLHLSDLCALRLTCHQANDFLSSGDVLNQWLRHSDDISPLQQQLYPPPSPPTFTYILEQRRRLCIVSDLSASLDQYIHNHILVHLSPSNPLLNQYRRMESIWHPTKGHIVPLLLLLQHYLEHAAHLWLTLPTTPIPAPKTFSEVFHLHERRIFAAYRPAQIQNANQLWLFLSRIAKHQLDRPSSPDRGLPGCTTAPPCHEALRTYLLFTNLGGVRALLRPGAPQTRWNAVHERLAALDPARNAGGWRASWRAASPRLRDPGPDEVQVAGALVMERGPGAVWTDVARQVLAEREGGCGAGEWREIGAVELAIGFLRDAAGYARVGMRVDGRDGAEKDDGLDRRWEDLGDGTFVR